MRSRVVRLAVSNTGHPELDHLAAQLAARESLAWYLRPPFLQGDADHVQPANPLLAAFAQHRLRRLRPELVGVRPILIRARAADLGAAALGVLSRRPTLRFEIERLRRNAIDRATARNLRQGTLPAGLIANFGAAMRGLTAARRLGIPAVLNYPTVHHRAAAHLVRDIMGDEDLRGTLDFVDVPERLAQTLDAELKAATHVLVPSRFAAKTFVDAGVPAEKVVVATFGCPQPEPVARRTAQSQTLNVGFAGQIGARKGFDTLLRAVTSAGTGVSLVVAGPFRGSPSTWASESFTHVGNLSASQLGVFLGDIDCLALLSRFEGLPTVVLQALARGTPCVVTPTGADDVIRDGYNGFIVPVGGHQEAATRFRRLRDDPALLASMSKAAIETARSVTWARYADAVIRGVGLC